MATLAHPAEGEFGNRGGSAVSMRRVLERAVDAAPSHVRPPHGRLRRLFARDRSARALIERYRLWPAIEHAYQRITREYGPMRVEISAEDGWGEPYVRVLFVGWDVPDSDDVFDFESEVNREIGHRVGKPGQHRLSVFIHPDYSHGDER
ncbi:MAG TPA: hypothetical protein VF092_24125 [Longimicrobium sp.]